MIRCRRSFKPPSRCASVRTDKLLLDTHVFLWWLSGDPRIGTTTRSTISRAALVFVSAASAWEAAIKAAIGRLSLPDSLEAGVRECGFEQLSIGFSHAEAAANLPPHHSDPFDRMLVAQAQLEGLALVTHDRKMAPYDVPILWI
ncbi:type II toxin-antitoxin system VapC family toxin [Candidatus Fermentibacteria bacterium]|nr:type II toxin-antitoxin system VapC family toxin [Candidatus Fermentibacteria bacterium]